MATVTALFACYFFFASIAGIFKFFGWKNRDRKIGVPVSMSEAKVVNTFVNGKQERYTYSVSVNEGYSNVPYSYVETKGQKAEHKIRLNVPMEFVVNYDSKTAITSDDYEQLKKNLYLNPLYCAGSIAITVLLVGIASSI